MTLTNATKTSIGSGSVQSTRPQSALPQVVLATSTQNAVELGWIVALAALVLL